MDHVTTAPHGRSARLGQSPETVAYLARNYKFESTPLHQRVHKLSVQDWLAQRFCYRQSSAEANPG